MRSGPTASCPSSRPPDDLAVQVEQALTRVVREKFAKKSNTAAASRRTEPSADVHAEHFSVGTDHRVIVHNLGEGEARHVTVGTVDAAGDERGWDLIDSDTPIDYLQPGGNFQYIAAIDMGSPASEMHGALAQPGRQRRQLASDAQHLLDPDSTKPGSTVRVG